jgi:protein-S-isoprenylcysteine O-methyltransferase Ste14
MSHHGAKEHIGRGYPLFGTAVMNLQTFAGVTLSVISIALTALARVQLGKSFAVSPKANHLVTRGLYSRLQHPMYLFVDLIVCGIALALDRWYVLLLLVILLPLQTRNARKERELLREKFGERFEIYRRATWF